MGRTSPRPERAGSNISKAMPNLAGGTTSCPNACAAAEHGTPFALNNRCATLALTGSPPCAPVFDPPPGPPWLPKLLCRTDRHRLGFDVADPPRPSEGWVSAGDGAMGDGEGSGDGRDAVACILPCPLA